MAVLFTYRGSSAANSLSLRSLLTVAADNLCLSLPLQGSPVERNISIMQRSQAFGGKYTFLIDFVALSSSNVVLRKKK